MDNITELHTQQEVTDFIMAFEGELTTKFNKVYSDNNLIAIYHKTA